MAKHNLLKKVAPVVMSAAVAFSSMPVTAFASDFADSTVEAAEVTEDEETADVEAADKETEDIVAEDVDDDELDVAEEEETEEAGTEETASEEDAFSAEESDDDFSAGEEQGEYTYVYAGLTWAEYWKSEGVYAAGETTANDTLDSHGEHDKGAFDTVTRATFNHGLHRGSYQCLATIITAEHQYQLSYWKNGSTPVLMINGEETDAVWTGAQKTADKKAHIKVGNGAEESVESYVVTGLKYVPVAVKTADYQAFCEAGYPIVANDSTLAGGFSEMNLSAYTEIANVTANTNGLKYATKNSDGTFSFSARQTGTDSGIKDQALKVAEGTEPGVKDATGSYGEFLRVDINGNYGGLGAAMQAVKWEYYGKESSTPIATFGTKFAADNWMHKAMGIQLGLTDSYRCQLPAGTDGTGHWKITIYALGYQDYTYEFDATYDNLVIPTDPRKIDTTELKAAIEKVNALKQADYTPDSWSNLQTEFIETQDMLDDINAALEKINAGQTDATVNFSQNAVNEQVNGHLMGAINSLVKVTFSLSKTSGTLTVGGTDKLTVSTNLEGTVAWKSSNEKVATVADGVVTAKAAGTATITAALGSRSATYTVTVKAAETQTKTPTKTQEVVKTTGITATVGQVYVGKKAAIKVTKENVTGTAKFKTSNKKVATVNAKGVVTGKKAGTAKITVTVGKYKKVLTVKVKKPSFKLAKSSAKIKKGKTTTIKVKAAPVSKVTYKSSNKKVATVTKKGVVKGKKKGTATITVKCNGITRKFKVTVK